MPPPRTTDNPYEAKKQYEQLLEMSKTVTFQDGIYRLLYGCARKGEPIGYEHCFAFGSHLLNDWEERKR